MNDNTTFDPSEPNEPMVTLPPIVPVTLDGPAAAPPPPKPKPVGQIPPNYKGKVPEANRADKPTLFRCMNCLDDRNKLGKMFERDVPVCPCCNMDGQQERFKRFIIPVEKIHFDPPHATIRGMHENHLACNPKLGVGSARASGEILAVNCPDCLECEAGQTALANRPHDDVHTAGDFPFRFTTPTNAGV